MVQQEAPQEAGEQAVVGEAYYVCSSTKDDFSSHSEWPRKVEDVVQKVRVAVGILELPV